MLTTKEAEAAHKEMVYPGRKDAEKYAIYENKMKAITAKWREWLEDEFGYDLPKGILDNLYDRAWSDGHHAGLHEVENHYDTYATFAREVLAAK